MKILIQSKYNLSTSGKTSALNLELSVILMIILQFFRGSVEGTVPILWLCLYPVKRLTPGRNDIPQLREHR
jgi:hypothetical protein